MNILMAFDSNYCKPAMVTMQSVLCNNPCEIRFYIIYSSLLPTEKERLQEFVAGSGHGTVEFLEVPAELFAELPTLRWISKETYYRLMAQKLLPESVERILWLDADMIVLQNIEEFYHQDMEGMLLVACSYREEGSYEESLRQLTLPADTRYFNAGMLLYDMKAQRNFLPLQVYEDYLKVFGQRLIYGDQDVLNAVFYRCVKFAELEKYNLCTNHLEKVSRKERPELLRNCKILHFNGSIKPWEEKYPFVWGYLFQKYAEMLPEYDEVDFEELKRKHKAARRRYLNYKKKHKEEGKRLEYSFVVKIAGKTIRIVHTYQKVFQISRAYLENRKDAEIDIKIEITKQDIQYEKEQYIKTHNPEESSDIPELKPADYEVAAANRKVAEALAEHGVLLLHGAAISVDDRAYLFVAKSGTGKTTHINLWRELLGEKAVVVNGDKPFVQVGEQVTVYGSPWCGKEGMNTNCAVRLAGICLLERGEENRIRKMEFNEAFPKLMSSVYRSKDAEKAQKIMQMVGMLENKVAFYQLQCTPEPEAAKLAYEAMGEDA